MAAYIPIPPKRYEHNFTRDRNKKRELTDNDKKRKLTDSKHDEDQIITPLVNPVSTYNLSGFGLFGDLYDGE